MCRVVVGHAGRRRVVAERDVEDDLDADQHGEQRGHRPAPAAQGDAAGDAEAQQASAVVDVGSEPPPATWPASARPIAVAPTAAPRATRSAPDVGAPGASGPALGRSKPSRRRSPVMASG